MSINLSAIRVVVAPGLHGSGPAHWQSRWERRYPHFERVQQAHWDRPVLDVWAAQVAATLAASPTPALVVAHSFGCLATVRASAAAGERIAGALLVAPADPHKFGVHAQVDGITLPFPALVVGSTNDPWMPAPAARDWAQRWGADFLDLGAAGHINADSGLGDWPAGLLLLHTLARRAAPSPVPSGPGRPRPRVLAPAA